MSLVSFHQAKKFIEEDWHGYHSHHGLVHMVNVRLEDGLYHFPLDLEGCCYQTGFRGPCLQGFELIIVQCGNFWQSLTYFTSGASDIILGISNFSRFDLIPCMPSVFTTA